MTGLVVSRCQAVTYRLDAGDLHRRLPAGEYARAARYGIQDTIPRSALVSLHARVEACEPTAWEDEQLIQTYSPRRAVYVVPRADWAVFTVGRLPVDPGRQRAVDADAERVCRALAGEERRARDLPDVDLRGCCASGRIAIRWDTRLTWFREVPRPDVDLDEARRELCRRHVRAFGPTTPEVFAWWAGHSVGDARRVWDTIASELVEVDLEGRRAWILAADEEGLRSAAPVPGVRLLPAEELKLFGADRAGLFAGPSSRRGLAMHDGHYPHCVVVDGELAGAWGRRGGLVRVRIEASVTDAVRSRIEAEALALPIPNATPSVDFA